MKSTIKILLLAATALLFVAAFAWLLTRHGPLAPVGVQLGEVTRTNLTPSVFGIGTVDARRSYAVGPIAPGRVLRVLVDQGDEVKAGQLLAEMDPVDLDGRIQAAQSTGARSRRTVLVADAQVAEAASRARLAATNRDRDQRLYEQGVISEQALDASAGEAERAEAALVAARANAAAVRQDTGRLDADLEGLGSLRDSLRLVSPADGVIVSREAESGDAVLAGQTVLRVIAPESLWVRARIDQSRAQGVQVGQRVSIVLRSAPGTERAGRVARVDLQSDPVTEERIVNVSFEAQPDRLYLGELAEVTIELPSETDVLVVPSAAIAREGQQTGVWQMVEGRARFAPVTIGTQSQAGLTEIRSGLAAGDSVIVYSSAQLRPAARVRVQEVSPR